jgi:hypothetical protein
MANGQPVSKILCVQSPFGKFSKNRAVCIQIFIYIFYHKIFLIAEKEVYPVSWFFGREFRVKVS